MASARLSDLILRARQRQSMGLGGAATARRLGQAVAGPFQGQDDGQPLHAIQNSPVATGGVEQTRSSVGADHAARQGLLLALAVQRARAGTGGAATNRRLASLNGMEPQTVRQFDPQTYSNLIRLISANRINRVSGPGASRYTRYLGP
jgi:hypothetical protein